MTPAGTWELATIGGGFALFNRVSGAEVHFFEVTYEVVEQFRAFANGQRALSPKEEEKIKTCEECEDQAALCKRCARERFEEDPYKQMKRELGYQPSELLYASVKLSKVLD